MKKLSLLLIVFASFIMNAQTNPAITKWLQNTTVMGSYFVSGNSTAITNNILANCQQVRYTATDVYVNATGIPAYPTGIFSGDGNPNNAGDQNAIYKLPLNPTQNTGTATATTAGNIGIFVNGVSLFDYRDGVSWNNNTGTLCGGPGGSTCPGGMGASQAWNRDAIPAERLGFDCAKGHPAGTNYHHHQNPSAFKYDSTTSNTYSAICNTYNSEGLYTINTTQHSPLIGFAYDGFPIYGAYGYTNSNGTGGVARMKSGYQLSTNTTRANGPAVNQVVGNQTLFNGYFREDYVYVANASDPTVLDVHNGRFSVTPEYPAGIYCYYATVNADQSSAYPYVVGPTFYGNKTGAKVTTVPTSTTYVLATNESVIKNSNIKVFPNPAQDFITVQADFAKKEFKIEMIDVSGKLIKTSTLKQGTTMATIVTDDVYNGMYFLKVSTGKESESFKVLINK
ncbi:YHYH protein [Frigoriflavimonas asaccharolytica]|uniref:Secreted protein (Por secretion system target) n=1 Tax=Frigoriflavimonas asaccharolytica TaxID=2735899 RepID=A0A8J8KB22_9FLAO|nr:YHYH protein [Frigoriflavimonas asaccharolytica]NRS92104.1 hypothetical protein [Frigoriflavimonas asaccharolytica]